VEIAWAAIARQSTAAKRYEHATDALEVARARDKIEIADGT
jgi:hypothetical protein